MLRGKSLPSTLIAALLFLLSFSVIVAGCAGDKESTTSQKNGATNTTQTQSSSTTTPGIEPATDTELSNEEAELDKELNDIDSDLKELENPSEESQDEKGPTF